MSNLNVNNIDVQRIINVVRELIDKTEFCSILTSKTFEKIGSRREEILEYIGAEILKDLDEHYLLMEKFFDTHLCQKIEVKDEKSELDDEEEETDHRNKEIIKYKENLKDIDEKKDEVTMALAKNVRALCRKYYKDKKLIDYLTSFRRDPEIIEFVTQLKEVLDHNIKKSKMTYEEEFSDRNLNKQLITKIIDLQNQINEKENKLGKLKQDHQDLKTNSLKKLEEINNEIEMIRNSTDNELQALEDSINLQLNNTEEKHISGKKKLDELLEQVTKEFIDKKNENEAEEMKQIANNMNAEINQFKASVGEYDSVMRSHKQTMVDLNKADDTAKAHLIETKIKRDKLREQCDNYRDAHSKYVKKMNDLKYEEEVKVACAEYVQATIRGYQTRKALLKKYKFLKVLRAPKIIEIDPNGKPGKGGKGGKPGK
jgi:hypothetical protein